MRNETQIRRKRKREKARVKKRARKTDKTETDSKSPRQTEQAIPNSRHAAGEY